MATHTIGVGKAVKDELVALGRRYGKTQVQIVREALKLWRNKMEESGYADLFEPDTKSSNDDDHRSGSSLDVG